MQQLMARIKRSSKYWGQTAPNAWFRVMVVGDAYYHLRGNHNNYRLCDVALGMSLADGSIIDLKTGKTAKRAEPGSIAAAAVFNDGRPPVATVVPSR